MPSKDFNMSTQDKLLGANDPAPFTAHEGTGSVIYTGPHNGLAVPLRLEQCLGTPDDWFFGAHESHDLYMAELFEEVKARDLNAGYLAGNYSRLVCDLNRRVDYSIWPNSSENKSFLIPANQPNNCCKGQETRRKEEIYHPYHQKKQQMIEGIRQKHGGVIVLDLHSFTKDHKGECRKGIEISTIRKESTPFSRALEGFFKNHQNEYQYVSGKPYKVADRPNNAAHSITNQMDLQYLGLEIRNDLLDTPKKREQMANFIFKAMNHVRARIPTDPEIIQNRSIVIAEEEQVPFSYLDHTMI